MARPRRIPDETIIDIFLASGPRKLISRKYGVSVQYVSKVKHGALYRGVTLPWDTRHGARIINAALISAAFGVYQ